jgi:hypothetical protein
VDSLRLTLLLFLTGEHPSNLPDVAREALDRGFDAPTLRRLAEHPAADQRETGAMLVRVAEEIGWDVPDAGTARVELVRHWAGEILTGQVTPIDGAQRIVRILGVDSDAEDSEAGVFATLVAKCDDTGEQEECERRIVAEAGLLVADTA